jgi:hypothetical protein
MFYIFHSYNDCIKKGLKLSLFILFLCFFQLSAFSQVKILFDNTKAEQAGNADWVIDEDGTTAAKIPTPAQSGITATTAETFWTGALSNWGVDCVKKGFTVETLPTSGSITYGSASNTQDLSNYKVFVIDEPNTQFTATEKTAIINFVKNGGGLFLISDHTGSDRNNDGWDSPRAWNNLIDTNTVQVNPFGIHINLDNLSKTYTNIATGLPASDSILVGPMGSVSEIMYSNGASLTISTAANPTVKAVIYTTSTPGTSNVLCAYSRYGLGKVAAVGDSSPFDDGTGASGNTLYNGYTGDAVVGTVHNHQNLIMNLTIWLAKTDPSTYTFTGNGNWTDSVNWLNGLVPPTTLPAGDSIIINNAAGGQCLVNIPAQHVSAGATMTVLSGKKLVLPGALNVK